MSSKAVNTLLSALLLGGTAIALMPSPSWAADTVEAKSAAWAVSRVASMSQGSYCTMAQRYENNSIMSFARNVGGDYSMAIDFQSPVFKDDAKKTITIQAGNGAKQSFEVMPQGRQTIVVVLGKDQKFFDQLSSTDTLNVSIPGQDMTYKTQKFKKGEGELAGCLSGIKSAAAAPAEPVEESAKIEPAAAAPAEPTAEGLLSARPNPSSGTEAVSSTQTSVPVEKVVAVKAPEPTTAPAVKTAVTAAAPAVSNEAVQKLQALQVENAELKRALAQSRQEFENKQAADQGAAVNELREKLGAAQNENQNLKYQIQNLQNKVGDTIKTADAVPSKAKEEISRLQGDSLRLNQEIKTLKGENETLRNQLKLAASASASAKGADDKAEAALQTRLADLTAQNTALQAQLDQAQKAAKEAASQEPASGDDQELRKKLRTLTTQVESLEGEKKALEARYETLQKESEKGQLKTVGGNWDLEQATRRYQESQREIRRLGALLDDERAKCDAEKKDIESMLFDPAIADSAQITKLDKLQEQVKEKEAKITEMQATIDQMQTRDTGVQINAMAMGASDAEVADLKGRLAQKEATIARLQADMQSLRSGMANNQASQQPAKPAAAQPVAYASQPQKAPYAFPSADEYASLLKAVGVKVNGELTQIKGGDPKTYRAYSWKTDSLYGSIEMHRGAAAEFNNAVSQYLERAKSRCKGQFAAVPSAVKAAGTDKSKSYEIACVNNEGTGSSASILFTLKDGVISTIAHEGRAASMEMAIDARDRIAKSYR